MGRPTTPTRLRLKAVDDLISCGWGKIDACSILDVGWSTYKAYAAEKAKVEAERAALAAKADAGALPKTAKATHPRGRPNGPCKLCGVRPYMGVCGCIEPANQIVDADGKIL